MPGEQKTPRNPSTERFLGLIDLSLSMGRKTRMGVLQVRTSPNLALLCLLMVTVFAPNVSAQEPPKPLSKDRVVEYLKGEVSPARVAEIVRQRGVDFETTPEIEKELRSAGATDALLATLRELAPKRSVDGHEKVPDKPSSEVLELTTSKAKLSYAIGENLGKQLKSQSIEIDPAFVSRGLQDGLTGASTSLTDDEVKAILADTKNQIQLKQKTASAEAGDRNKIEGHAYLADNRSREGVVTLPSGMQYKILKVGYGKKPTVSDTVVCNYRGVLVNGKEFDSSYKRGEAATFPVSGVIKGWTEALQLMSVGSKWKLFIPPDLAYGDRGAGPDIGPNATLIFEVELLSIK